MGAKQEVKGYFLKRLLTSLAIGFLGLQSACAPPSDSRVVVLDEPAVCVRAEDIGTLIPNYFKTRPNPEMNYDNEPRFEAVYITPTPENQNQRMVNFVYEGREMNLSVSGSKSDLDDLNTNGFSYMPIAANQTADLAMKTFPKALKALPTVSAGEVVGLIINTATRTLIVEKIAGFTISGGLQDCIEGAWKIPILKNGETVGYSVIDRSDGFGTWYIVNAKGERITGNLDLSLIYKADVADLAAGSQAGGQSGDASSQTPKLTPEARSNKIFEDQKNNETLMNFNNSLPEIKSAVVEAKKIDKTFVGLFNFDQTTGFENSSQPGRIFLRPGENVNIVQDLSQSALNNLFLNNPRSTIGFVGDGSYALYNASNPNLVPEGSRVISWDPRFSSNYKGYEEIFPFYLNKDVPVRVDRFLGVSSPFNQSMIGRITASGGSIDKLYVVSPGLSAGKVELREEWGQAALQGLRSGTIKEVVVYSEGALNMSALGNDIQTTSLSFGDLGLTAYPAASGYFRHSQGQIDPQLQGFMHVLKLK